MKQHYTLVRKFSFFFAFLFFALQGSAQIYVVNSLQDDGTPGTLRDAINQVNAGANTTINFDFSALGAAPYTITLLSSLPTIQPVGAAPIVINGYSEPSSSAGDISSRIISVQINGNGVAPTAFTIGYSGVEISGLAIYSCQTTGISILTAINNTFIWGNFIGTDNTGLTTSIGNGSEGILAGSFGSLTPITNLVVGTDGNGVNDAAEGNLFVNNGSGGFTHGGVVVINTTNSRFSGNIIGLGKDGVSKTNLYNFGTGLVLFDRSTDNFIGTNGDGISDDLERNFISNNGTGLWIQSKSNSNTISNNVIGLDIAGGKAGNATGLIIDNSSQCLIGTNADGNSDDLERNYIGASINDAGIVIKAGGIDPLFDQNSEFNKIVGNRIGVSFDDVTPAENVGPGILLQAQAAGGFSVSSNIIGSDGSGVNESAKGNIIAKNTSFYAIKMEDLTNTNLVFANRVSKNSIYENGGGAGGSGGINLVNAGEIAGTGVTANQAAGFSATGPNNLLNYPVITSITSDFANITFSGFARPGAVIEFYIADKGATSPAPLGTLSKNFGQGKTFLFQALQGGTLNGITDVGTNVPGSYTTVDQGTPSGASPIITDYTFQFVVNAASIGIAGGTVSFTALQIDDANTSGHSDNTSAFSSNFDANLVSLPITLISFTGTQKEGKAYLQWSTSAEYNNASFDIEKSGNGSSFSKIGNVKALTGSSVKKYEFIDNQLSGNINFYRLKQIDIDGKYSYTKVIALRTDLSGNAVKLFPSPFSNNLNLSVSSQADDKLDIAILDQSGRITKRYSMPVVKGTNSFNINNLSDLPSGIYVIKISGKTISYQQKISKN